jgi:hypothetical protein
MTLLQQLDVIFSVSNGLVFAMICLLVLVIYSGFFAKQATLTHYQRTDMVDMSLTATEYMSYLKSGDIRGEWKPVFNGKFLPLDAGVMDKHLAAQAELATKDKMLQD